MRAHVSEDFVRNERVYRLLAEYSQDILWVFSLETMRFTFYSPAIERFTGYTVQEALGRGLEVSLPPESYKRAMKLLSEKLLSVQSGQETSDRIVKFEYEAYHKDGRAIWFEATMAFQLDERGKPIAFVGISREITERKEAEEELEKSRDFANTILNTLDAHIAILDAQGVIITINDAWRHFAEQNQGRLSALSEGSNYLEVCEKASATGDELATKALAGIRGVMSKKISFFEMEYPCHSPNEQRWFLMRVIPLVDGSGQIKIAHLNITSQKLAEIRLEEKEQRLEDIASKIPGVIFQFVRHRDGSFSVPYFSAQAKNLTGISAQKVMDEPHLLFEQIHAHDVEMVYRAIDESAKAMSKYLVEYRIRTFNHYYRWLHAESTPRMLDNGDILWNGVSIDITDRKRVEEEREKTIEILRLINQARGIEDLAKIVTEYIRDWLAIEAVGIRFKEGDDYPYYETKGFPQDFVLAEITSAQETTQES